MGGKGKKATKTHAARAFGKNGLGQQRNIQAVDWDTAEIKAKIAWGNGTIYRQLTGTPQK